MNTEILWGKEIPASLAEEWEKILPRFASPSPFLSPTWVRVWLNHLGREANPFFILFRSDEGLLLGVGAFENRGKETGNSGLSLLGSGDVCDYRDFMVVSGYEEEIYRNMGALLREHPWQFMDLPGISEFSPSLRWLPPVMESFGFEVTVEAEETGVFLPLPPSWNEFLEKLRGKDRHELRRKMRRLEREASFAVKWAGEGIALEEGIPQYLDLHRRSRPDKADFMNPAREAFFRELARRFHEKEWLRLSFLEVAGHPAATFFSFRFDRTEYVYNSGFDPELSRFSPGIVLAAFCIQKAMDDGLKTFNFLRGQEDYKYMLGGREERIYRIRVNKK